MDCNLVLRAQRGDVEAFSTLTAALTDRLLVSARLILRDEDDAADVVQDALIRAWLDLRGLRDPDRFEAWVQRIVIRACHRAAKRRRRRSVVELWAGSAGEPIELPGEGSLVERDRLERGFERFTVEQRAVVVLRYFHDLTLQDCAEILGVPLGTVQSRLNRATQALRAAIEADERAGCVAPEVI